MSEDRQNVDTAAEPDEKGWEALRPAVKYPVAEGALDEAPAADGGVCAHPSRGSRYGG